MTVTYSAEPILEWSAEKGHFLVHDAFTASWLRPGKEIYRVRVAKGFGTDLASIPQIFRSLIPQRGKHIQPAIAHDYCYVFDQGISKADADAMFLAGMKSVGVAWWKRRLMWAAVRLNINGGHWKPTMGV